MFGPATWYPLYWFSGWSGDLSVMSMRLEYGQKPDGTVDYVKGANIAGFVKVADAMIAFGVV